LELLLLPLQVFFKEEKECPKTVFEQACVT
jgi:hypothetical protein